MLIGMDFNVNIDIYVYIHTTELIIFDYIKFLDLLHCFILTIIILFILYYIKSLKLL